MKLLRNVTKFLTKKAQLGIIYCKEFAPFRAADGGIFIEEEQVWSKSYPLLYVTSPAF